MDRTTARDRADETADPGSPAAGGLAAGVLTAVFPGDGEMAARCRAFDWAATPLGPVTSWSHSLRTTVGIVLTSRQPMFLWWGPDLVQVYNDAYAPSLGTGGRAGHALGARGRAFWDDIWDAIGPQIAGVMATGEAIWREDQYLPIERNSHLEDVWWTYSYSPVRDDDGRIAATLVVCQETTARVRAERERDALLAAVDVERRRLADAFRQAPAFLAIVRGPDHMFELANESYDQLIGHRPLLGRPIREALPEVVDQGFIAILDAVLATGEPFHGRELPILLARTPGAAPEERFVTFVYQPLVEADGTRSGVFVHGVDVTESVRGRRAVETTAAALAASEAQVRAVIDEAADAVFVADATGHYVDVNRRGCTLLGYDREGLIGRTTAEMLPAHERQRAIGLIARLSERPGQAEVGEWDLRTADGGFVPVEISATVLADGRWQALVRDLRPRREAEAERARLLSESETARTRAERAQAEAEAANAAKSQFLTNMSHELRTPLNAIQGYVQLLDMGLHGPVTDAQHAALERVDRAQRHLLGLVNDVLNYARLGSGRVEFDVQAIRATDAVEDVLPLIEPQLAAKALSIDLRLGEADAITLTGDGVPSSVAAPLVWADREKLGQILLNLLSNAVKFTPRGGGVTVELIARGDDASDEHLYLRVADSGIGIPPDKLDAIFEPFVQVRSDLARAAGGTGLGLAISRDLARGMGGDIRVRSAEGVGSTFSVALRRVTTPDGRPIERRVVERRVQVERRKHAPRRSGQDRRDDTDPPTGATD